MSAKKRSTEERIEYYTNKIRKQQEKNISPGTSLNISGTCCSSSSPSSDNEELSNHGPLFNAEASTASDLHPPAPVEPLATPERSVESHINLVTKDAHDSDLGTQAPRLSTSTPIKPRTGTNSSLKENRSRDTRRSRSTRVSLDTSQENNQHVPNKPQTRLEGSQTKNRRVLDRADEANRSRNETTINSSTNNPRTSLDTSQANNNLGLEMDNELDNLRQELANSSMNRPRTTSETSQAHNSYNNRVPENHANLADLFAYDFLLKGEDIHSSIAKEWTPILQKGLSEVYNATLQKQYTTPDNCKLLKTPELNEEVIDVIDEQSRNKDKSFQKKQDQFGLAMTAIARGITLFLNHYQPQSGQPKQHDIDIIKHFRQGSFLLADLHFEQTKTRRDLCGSSNPKLKQILCDKIAKDKQTPSCANSNLSFVDKYFDRDDTLFGLKVGKMIKKYYNAPTQGHSKTS